MLKGKPTEQKKPIVNPFDRGVSLKSFLDALGNKSVEDYLKNTCNKEQVKKIKKELEIYKKLK